MAATTRRASEGAPVDLAEAKAAWARSARPVLEKVAADYNGFLTYQQLAEMVQEDSGIVTGVPFRHWIGGVLGAVARAQAPDEPILTSLVVRANGSVGDGYAIPLEERGEEMPSDLDLHAAAERLKCYEHYGAQLPADGGSPQLTPQVLERRQRSSRPASEHRSVCPTCHMVVPLSGECDYCVESSEPT